MVATHRRAVPLPLLTLVAGVALAASALPARADPPAAKPGAAAAVASTTLTLSARSIGSKRGEPPQRQAHAALLIRIAGRPGGFIIQGGREKAPGLLPRDRVVGYVIPCQDPDADFRLAFGAWWGEPTVRELPTRNLSTWTQPGLDEARIRAVVDSLNVEFGDRTYRLESGPSSNSFVSRFLERLGVPLPSIGSEELPGWGWKP